MCWPESFAKSKPSLLAVAVLLAAAVSAAAFQPGGVSSQRVAAPSGSGHGTSAPPTVKSMP